ncbi:MAG: glucose-6-phosphate dehydrogenase, partial [Planctomycetaceae bacterium]|nr:glucose-6-phosphate dehydrogenase [Planctomycetaceae bacterium]
MALPADVAPASLPIEDVTLLIFGASGDLTARKLVPALFQLARNGYLSPRSLVVGVARREKTDEQFRQEMHDAVRSSRSNDFDEQVWAEFASRLCYEPVELDQASEFTKLRQRVEEREKSAGLTGRRVVYLATTPELFLPSVEGLAAADMLPPRPHRDRLRIVFEKPFGHDLASAQTLS